MASLDTTAATPPPEFATTPTLTPSSGALHEATLEFFSADDPGSIAGMALASAGQVIETDGASIWIAAADQFICRGAIGEGRELLAGVTVGREVVASRVNGEHDASITTAMIHVNGRETALLRATRSLDSGAEFSAAERDALQRLADAAGAAMASAARLAASQQTASDSARDLALITEMSREITSTLDLDRVLRSVVNLSSRALSFDRGAVALYEHGVCDIRAVAGAAEVDSADPALQDLAVRAAWAAGLGESFYLSERTDPGSDAERMFVNVFGGDLERDGVMSGLYLPLKDEEGIVGILLFEADRAEFATEHQRELAEILTNQATVAVRNARLYHQVPMADAIGAFSARKAAFLELPRRRRAIYAAAALLTVAALTLIRWPLRVVGADPVFRPLMRAEVRSTVGGVIDRVFVREGMTVERGAPVAHLRDDELRAQRDAAVAAVEGVEREASIAASRGDAGAEQLQRTRTRVLRRAAGLLDEQLASSTLRAPVRGVVLTARPEERVGSHAEAGDLFVVVGRTDSLELEFGVDQRDIARVREGDEVHLRVDALPQQTFTGHVMSVAPLAHASEGHVLFPVRATFGNTDALLRPGMAAYARVLTEPASVLWRLVRDPMRAVRLSWWRMWS